MALSGPASSKTEPDDAEVLAVDDELGGVELQLLVGAQNLLLPFSIVHWGGHREGRPLNQPLATV